MPMPTSHWFGTSRHASSSSDGLDGGGRCNLTVFEGHKVPQTGTNYFSSTCDKRGEEFSYTEQMLVCIPAYNEQGSELIATLGSLYEQTLDLPQTEFNVCLILDGWNMVSKSMKQTIAGLMGQTCIYHDNQVGAPTFTSDGGKGSGSSSPRTTLNAIPSNASFKMDTHDILDVLNTLYQPGVVGTVVLENLDAESQEVVPVMISPGKWMNITVIVKLDNRRKHNSHQWFLAGFGEAYKSTATYLFLTDTGTYFAPQCLSKLTALLRDEPEKYCAAVAFQRPAVTTAGRDFNKIFHGFAQRYEFYSANYGTAAAFALVGFQPVIPGPCQLMTASAGLNPEFQDSYYAVGDMDLTKADFITANMQLAEDRFFTNFLYSTSHKDIGYVPDAIFHYDLTVAPAEFLSQRRRWTNGTIAASIRLLADYPVWSKNMPRTSSILVLLSMYTYVFKLFISMITPGLLGGGVFQAVGLIYNGHIGYEQEYRGVMSSEALKMALLVSGLYFAMHIKFMLVHHKTSYSRFWYELNQSVNTAFVAILTASGVWQLVFQHGEKFASLFLASTAIVFCYPAFASVIIQDWAGLFYGSVCFIPYYMFRASYTLATSYGVAQCWNLTWGTRPHDNTSQNGQDYEKAMVRIYRTSRIIMACYLVGNFITAAIIAFTAYNYNLRLLLILQAGFMLPAVMYYLPALVFFTIYGAKKLYCQITQLKWSSMRRSVRSFKQTAKTISKSRKLSFLVLLALTQASFMIRSSVLIQPRQPAAIDAMPIVNQVPFLDALKGCASLSCLKEAHMQSVEASQATFNFPHALFVGWDETNSGLLQNYMLKHDQTVFPSSMGMSTYNEPEFFTLQCKADPVNGCSAETQSTYIKDTLRLDEYVERNGQALTFESSSNYGPNGEHLAAGIKQTMPWVKVVATLREPISRALQNLQWKAKYANKGCFYRASTDLYNCLLHESLLAPRLYGAYDFVHAKNPSLVDAIRHWVTEFPAGQFKVVQHEELSTPDKQSSVFNDLSQFLGVETRPDVIEAAVADYYPDPNLQPPPEKLMISREEYEDLVGRVREESEEVAKLLADGGYITDAASFVGNWERVWQSNLDNCGSDGMCMLNLS